MTDAADLEQRVDDLLARLPIGEKVALMFHTMAVIGDPGDGFEGMPLPSLQTLLDLGLRTSTCSAPARTAASSPTGPTACNAALCSGRTGYR
ncbi:hypothetical protein [Mycobacterium sp. NPDC050041]|uniref:hypothetical protein n=1 Tax=Mycobacterium sp. NPDC050041 TaxID=3364293 RepID=UPI003C2F8095